MKLIQKLVEVRKHIGVLQKTQKGQSGQYVDPAVLLLKATTKMNDLNVFLTSSVTSHSVTKESNPTKNKKDQMDFCVSMSMEMTFHDGETGEKMIIPWFAVGTHMTDPAMAGGGALTYYERYFFMKQFNIPTTKDDPEFLADQVNGPELVNEKQLNQLVDMINRKKTNEKFLAVFNASDPSQIPAKRFNEAMSILKGLEDPK